MQRTEIDWPGLTHTWNPATGCLRKCSYCYARKIHNRFNKTPFEKIVIHPERLYDPYHTKKPSVIFVGSMTDIYYWEKAFLRDVVNVCKNNDQHEFMFLSKSYRTYWGIDWPPNTMQGLTVENLYHEVTFDNVCRMYICPRPFLSIEPLTGPVEYDIPSKYELVIVGAMTGCGRNNIAPTPEWIKSIKDHAASNKIYWKSSMTSYFRIKK